MGYQQSHDDDDDKNTEIDLIWNDETTRSKAAKMILFDQLTRNCFRRQKETYAYDDQGFKEARELAEVYLQGEHNIPVPYIFFANVCLTHSELLADHTLFYEVLEKIQKEGTAP